MIMIKKTLTLIAALAAVLTATAQVKVSVHETAPTCWKPSRP